MKGDEPPSEFLTLTDPLAVRALCNPELRAVIAPFLARERSITQVAAELSVGRNALLLKVRRLVRLGLLKVTRVEPRAGRAVKYYQTVSPGFFVPFSATPFDTPEQWMQAEYQARERTLARQTMNAGVNWQQEQQKPDFGLRFFQRPDGIVEADFAFEMQEEPRLDVPEAPAVMSAFVFTELEDDAAKELQRELLRLVQRYEQRGRGKKYVLRLGLAPL